VRLPDVTFGATTRNYFGGKVKYANRKAVHSTALDRRSRIVVTTTIKLP
jgi:hypothetical protein